MTKKINTVLSKQPKRESVGEEASGTGEMEKSVYSLDPVHQKTKTTGKRIYVTSNE